MDRDRAKQEVKERIEEYLQGKGINTRRPFNCLNPEHSDSNPSMSLDRNRHKVHCFSCGADYDTLDLIGIDYGLTGNDLFLKAYELFGLIIDSNCRRSEPPGRIPAFQAYQNQTKNERQTQDNIHNKTYTNTQTQQQTEDYTEFYREAHSRISETTYPQERGLSEATINRFMLGYADFSGRATGGIVWKALIIPTSESSYVVRNTDPHADAKNRYRKRGASHLFNAKALTADNKPVFVVEGEIDALSILEVGGEAIATGSTANIPLLLRTLEKVRPAQPLIIALDNDKAGAKAAGELAEGLERLQIPFYRLNPAGEYKDANEALQKDREGFTAIVRGAERLEQEAIEAQKEEYLKSSTAYFLQAFIDGITDSVNTPYTPTGFSRLDEALDGGLYEGLYICGAISSLGKTTLVTQIADQIAQAGQDVLIFSLEMARNEIIAKSISRHTLTDVMANGGEVRNAKTTRGITTGKRYSQYSRTERELINRAIMAYSEYAGRIYIEEGIGDIGAAHIRERVRQHITFTGHTPIVVVDYLQILAPCNERATDKQNTDKAVMELKRISRDYKTPVIAISSFNRANYSQAVTMEAFKESGAVEYSSDVLIGLQLAGAGKKDFDATTEKKKNPRQVELVILKNRNGRTGDKITLEYYPLFNYFKESDRQDATGDGGGSWTRVDD